MTVSVAGSLELVDESGLLTLVTTTAAGGEVVITAIGDIDLSSAPAFDACLADGLDLPGCRTLIVDLCGVLFLGARAGGSLGEARERADRCHLRFSVVADTRGVLRALYSTAANGVAVFPTVSAARAATAAS
ncbi:STAS domain-containing protein [Pseudonocardia sp. 73-21]|uniref:STAS domain-containing protein n=1 Tax=Pseudonocardia sp. 73-21 TaxID=1895809 RepID=UPI000963096B|nr:STAS domain-containing protein [Pseudonocardia sp. 73-21]OJY39277.1 MAG: hypothetical protein BGP03_23220 [Pseudonocardia sp. 73-21]